MFSKAIQKLTIAPRPSQFSFQQQPKHINPKPPFQSQLEVLSHLVHLVLLEKSKQQQRLNIQECCSSDDAKIPAKDNKSLFGISSRVSASEAINTHADEMWWSGFSLLC